jgi:P27 family predicted phage terminase small subunit
MNEPEVPPDAVVKPEGLSPGASRVWDRVAPVCLYMRTLTAADVESFSRYCEIQATADASAAEKDRPGFSMFLHTTMVDSAGNEHQQVKIHPAIKIELETSVKLRPFFEYFGLCPSGRARLHVPKAEAPVSKWAGVK